MRYINKLVVDDNFVYISGYKPLKIIKINENKDILCEEGLYLKRTFWNEYWASLVKEIHEEILGYASKELDTLFCLISRNGNSSIVSSGLILNEKTKNIPEQLTENDIIWRNKDFINTCIKNEVNELRKFDVNQYNNRVIVLDNPIDRFLRVINKLLKDDLLATHISRPKNETEYHDFINKCIYYINLCENDDNFMWERHFGFQKTYWDYCNKLHNNWEIVFLSDLPQWFEKKYGFKLLKNNISKETERKITKNMLSDEHYYQIYDIMKKEIEFIDEKCKK